MDHIWAQVNPFGLYQWIVLGSLPLAVLAAGGNFLLNTYLIMEPEWACQTPAIPQANLSFSRNCSLYHSCQGQLQYQAQFHSITEEYGLLCERAYISHSIVSLSSIPTYAGLLLWGTLSDSHGRKSVTFVSTLVMMAASLGCVITPTWQSFTAFRMLWGFMFAGAGNIYVVWVMEFTDQDHGFLINTLTHWHFTYMIVAGLGYATRHWQSYLLVLNALCAPILLLYAFFFTESPRWLIQKGRLEEALKALRYIWKCNNFFRPPAKDLALTAADLKGADSSGPEAAAEGGKRFNFFALFTRERAVTSLALGVTFLTASICSGTIILDAGQLAGGVFQNLFLIGAFRLFTPLLSVLLDWRLPNFGRRPFFFAANGLVLGCFLVVFAAITVLPGVLGDAAAAHLAAFFSLAGAISNLFVWIVIVQFAFELYPTLLRTTASAYTGLADATGAVLVPQIVYLRRFWPAAPISIAIVSLLLSVGIGSLVYPETKATKERVLPRDTVPLLREESEEESEMI